jgi:hypothetical protein
MLRAGHLLPPEGLLTLGFDTGRSPPDAASLLPGLLAATRTGLPPAADTSLSTWVISSASPPFAGDRGPGLLGTRRFR